MTTPCSDLDGNLGSGTLLPHGGDQEAARSQSTLPRNWKRMLRRMSLLIMVSTTAGKYSKNTGGE
jgi:hypothetical protein